MIDELISLMRPLYTLLMIIILGYLVSGFTKRNIRYTEFPEDCTIIYKPERTIEDKYIFEYDDPWLERFNMPPIERDPDLNHDFDTIEKRMKDNNVVRYNK